MSHKPVCVKCQTEMVNVRSGVAVLDTFIAGGTVKQQAPYQLWQDDFEQKLQAERAAGHVIENHERRG